VGRGASLLLNVPPDRRGLLHDHDVRSWKGFGELVNATFRHNLGDGAKAAASNVRGGSRAFSPRNVLDGDRYSYWSTDDAVTAAEVVLDLERPVTFNVIRLRENIRLGQRIEEFSLDRWVDGVWSTFAQGTSVGGCRILRAKEDVTANRVRLRITRSAAPPALSELGLFREAGMERA
jgi:alpha-L-fucosidase